MTMNERIVLAAVKKVCEERREAKRYPGNSTLYRGSEIHSRNHKRRTDRCAPKIDAGRKTSRIRNGQQQSIRTLSERLKAIISLRF